MLVTALTCLLAGCVFTESETTACPYCGAQITLEEAGDHRIPGCGVAAHAICVKGPSPEHDETCEICGGPFCTGGHLVGFCGLPDHCLSDGEDHLPAKCAVSGHFECDDADHAIANCGVEGHYVCLVGSHSGAPCFLCGQPQCVGEHGDGICNKKEEEPGEACPTCGDPLNDGDDHGATDCHFKSTHRHCDGMDHTRCDICKGWLCNGSTHEKGICDQLPEEIDWDEFFSQIPDPSGQAPAASDASALCPHCGSSVTAVTDHTSPCGVAGHYICDDGSHGTAGCGHSPACTLTGDHDSAPCLVHYKCTDDYIEADHSVKYPCTLHSTCEQDVTGLNHDDLCQTCNKYLCSDHHRYICSAP